jgi:hypothetical protein
MLHLKYIINVIKTNFGEINRAEKEAEGHFYGRSKGFKNISIILLKIPTISETLELANF